MLWACRCERGLYPVPGTIMKRKDVHRWFRPVRAPMSIASYRRLPRHPAYKFEYWDGQLRITPRWNSHAMFLPLRSPEEAVVPELEGASIRPLQNSDWDVLPNVLALAFADAPPLSVLRGRRRVWAARTGSGRRATVTRAGLSSRRVSWLSTGKTARGCSVR